MEANIALIRQQYPDNYLYIAGDLNARTKDLLDFIPDDTLDYVFNVNVDYTSDYFCIPRNSRDVERYNLFGKSLVELCCIHDVHILNGRLYDDIVGNFTCLTNNGAS